MAAKPADFGKVTDKAAIKGTKAALALPPLRRNICHPDMILNSLMVISGVMLATSTGIGLVTWISTFLFGVPWIGVGTLVIPGAILVALSRYKFGDRLAMSTCVWMAYKLLESRNVPLVQT